jgi:tRNA-dihydrouridine synthase A
LKIKLKANAKPALLSVAPMMDWTDRHCRVLHRLISKETLLYSEMVTTGALIHGDQARHLDFDELEHPLVLQLGGSEPEDLAQCAKLAQDWGYDEVNLNCGCPSERVQRGAFGACLMAEPALVADAVKAMRDVVDIEVSVKHRIGIDEHESYEFVRDFVGLVSEAGCRVFVVHARIAILKGLSPKENREIPPLRYEVVERLKRDFPECYFVLNGGIQTQQQVIDLLPKFDGLMLGRAAYHQPWLLSEWDALCRSQGPSFDLRSGLDLEMESRKLVEQKYVHYMHQQKLSHGTPWSHMSRHMLGLYHAVPGARLWRQVWSDASLKNLEPMAVMELAHEAMDRAHV